MAPSSREPGRSRARAWPAYVRSSYRNLAEIGRQNRFEMHYGTGEASTRLAYAGLRGSKCLQWLAPAWGASLSLMGDDLLELVPLDGAALRAWVRFDVAITEGARPLDNLGCPMLNAFPADRLQLRVPPTLKSANAFEERAARVRPLPGPARTR